MRTRTSESDPIRIAELEVPGTSGRIGITFCPGKKDRAAGWNRDLDTDLDAIQAWGAAAVVTLIEPHEFQLLGVPDLGAGVERRAIRWFHLPITDVSVPDSRFEERWPRHRAEIQGLLRDGERVVVHCRGGLGRAGTVAACLLIDLGVVPETAIAEVRRVRPGAIETKAQEHYVRSYRSGHGV